MVSLRTMLAPGFKSVYLPKGSIQNQVTEAIAQTLATEQSCPHARTHPFAHAITTTVNKGIFMKTKNIGLISALTFFLSACGSYGKPPLPATQAWYPTASAKIALSEAFAQCRFVDRLLVGVQRINQQSACMRQLGFELDTSSYRPDNCYGDAPAGCIVQWPNGVSNPKTITPLSSDKK
jgi:hypothetical protein